ncbi:MAG: ABC transporter [Crenarchaeota archaeon]|nr:ABC transporter [Thermoproteota archaeon]
MRRLVPLLLLAALAFAARPAGPVILLDFSHGENTRGLCEMLATVPEAYWVLVVPEGFQLPQCGISPTKVVTGNFESPSVVEELKKADVLIIGQPTKYFTDAEIKNIANWFKEPGKVLWCAADSDYPAQGGTMEAAQHACNAIFEAVGTKLRFDYVSVEDVKCNAGAPYRVIGKVKPDPKYDAQIIAFGAEKVLFHGPGAVAWVDEQGNWRKLTDPETPENLIKIVVTTDQGRIVEHQPRAPGAPGEFGKAHAVGETGTFVLMAAEVIGEEAPYNVVIASGESPYGGYQPMVTFRYKDKSLDGPRFVRNVLLWSLDYYSELKVAKQMAEGQAQAMAALGTVQTLSYVSLGLAALALVLGVLLVLGII